MKKNQREKRRAALTPPEGTTAERRPSVAGYVIAGCVWVIYAVVFPLYRFVDYAIAACVCAAVWALAYKFLPASQYYVEQPYSFDRLGDYQVDMLLRFGAMYVLSLVKNNARIEDEELRVQQNALIVTAKELLQALYETPQRTLNIRQVLNFYLPAANCIVAGYRNFLMLGASSAAREERRLDTLQALGMLHKTMLEIQSAFFQDPPLDVSADVTNAKMLIQNKKLMSDEELTSLGRLIGPDGKLVEDAFAANLKEQHEQSQRRKKR